MLRLAALALALPAASPPASGQETPSEKRLLAEFQDAFGAAAPEKRADALTKLGEDSRDLPDKGASKAVAKALLKGLEDADLGVANAAMFQFAYGRDVETTLAGLEGCLTKLYAELERNAGKRSPQAREEVERGSVLFINGCKALAFYPDDRSAAFLAKRLAALTALGGTNDLALRLAGPLAACALDLGTLNLAAATVKLAKALGGPPVEAAREVHEALSELAGRLGDTPPEFADGYAAAWQRWLESNADELPKKLGKLAAPPGPGHNRGMDGMPGKSG